MMTASLFQILMEVENNEVNIELYPKEYKNGSLPGNVEKCVSDSDESCREDKANKLHQNKFVHYRSRVIRFLTHDKWLKLIYFITALLLVGLYLFFAFQRSFTGPFVILCSVLCVVSLKVWRMSKETEVVKDASEKIKSQCLDSPIIKKLCLVKYLLIFSSWIVVLAFVAHSCYLSPRNLVSAAGLALLLIISFLISQHPDKISTRIVLCGLNLQFLLGLLITRTKIGSLCFQGLGKGASLMAGFSRKGSEFIFGPLLEGHISRGTNVTAPLTIGLTPHYFVFAIHTLPIIVVYCSFTAVLYHFGIMQAIIKGLASVMYVTIGTSAPETLNAAANVFLGQTEAPLLIKPLIPKLTRSELHAVMTGGFATIAGALLAAYTDLGIDSSHLIAASLMNAPAALVFSKIVYPETVADKKDERLNALVSTNYRNVFEAAAQGASDSIMFVLNVTMNLIAFIAIREGINYVIGLLGGFVGYPEFCLESITSYFFYPLALVLGVDTEDTPTVAELIGTKTTVNEFVAYEKLSKIKANEEMSERSITIATYALCGFANFASLGIQIGGIGALAPTRLKELSALGLTALLCGSFACFSNACVMGLLF